MPSFLKDLGIRRKSKASFKTPQTSASSTDGSDEQPPSKSSSTTLNSQSPPTTLSAHSRSNTNLVSMHSDGTKTPPLVPVASRPRLPSSQSNRRSMIVSDLQRKRGMRPTLQPQGLPTQNGERTVPATSQLAPRILSVSDGSWVHQKVLLISGECADTLHPIDGTLTVGHSQDIFPPTQWPVCGSKFKALVYLQPGPNRLRLDFTSPKLPTVTSSIPAHSSWVNINYLPLIASPPLQLCILIAKDSPETYDAIPERVQKEGNGLSNAIRKFRMAAYLWQAFTGEQMNRNGFGRRCYRYEEEWQPGTLTCKDTETGQMRNEAKIHVVRLDQTVDEIRDLELAQQYEPAQKKGDLFGIAMDAVRKHFAPRPGQTQYVSCMLLDTKWDKTVGTIRGHAALGGGDESIKLAIFGSHCLQSYPSYIEEVVPAFTDCTRTDINFVANDCGESGSSWEAANIGIGAHLHETGHLLGCPHQESGVMMRDYTTFNRTFVCREPFSTRTGQPGLDVVLSKDECTWHRLDTLRFRYHPCFMLPSDSAANPDRGLHVWTVENGTVLITANTGVAWIEIYPEGDGECHHWIEFTDHNNTPPRQVTLTEQQLKEKVPKDKQNRDMKLKIFSAGGGEHEVPSFVRLCSNEAKLRLPDGRSGFRSFKVGASAMEGSQPQELVLGSCQRKSKLLLALRIHKGDFLDGVEFLYEDGTNEIFGHRGGRAHEFQFDTRRGEMLLGFFVRAGYWIDGIQVLTTTGRKSELFGDPQGGTGYTFIPPRGYGIAGLYGSCGSWLDGFGLIITR